MPAACCPSPSTAATRLPRQPCSARVLPATLGVLSPVQHPLSRGRAGCHADVTGDSGRQDCPALAWVFVKVACL